MKLRVYVPGPSGDIRGFLMQVIQSQNKMGEGFYGVVTLTGNTIRTVPLSKIIIADPVDDPATDSTFPAKPS